MPYFPEFPLQPEPVLPIVREEVYEQQLASLEAHSASVIDQSRRNFARRDTILARWVHKNAEASWPDSESVAQFAIDQAALTYDLLLKQSVADAAVSIHLEQIPGDIYQQDILAASAPPLPMLKSGPRLQEAIELSRSAGIMGIRLSMDVMNPCVGRLIAECPGAPDEAHREAGQQLASFSYDLLRGYVSLSRQARR